MFAKDLRIRAVTVLVCLMTVLLVAAVVGDSVPAISRQGSSGAQVRQIQERLIALGYLPAGSADGVYGAKTASAVRRFQQAKGITSDGVAGVVTLAALNIVFRQGSRGEDVTSIQQRLKTLGYLAGSADGSFGAQTVSAVKEFQKQNNLTADGVVGFATAKQLYSSSAKRKSSSAGSHSDNDYTLLARIISAEARGEPYSGQVAVGAVVLNRVEHPSFPDTVAGVVYQSGAFDAVLDGQVNMQPAESSLRAAREAINGSDPSGGAIYYYNPVTATNRWIRSRPVIITIGKHVFCK